MAVVDWTPVERILLETSETIEGFHDEIGVVSQRVDAFIGGVVEGIVPGVIDALIGAIAQTGTLNSGLLDQLVEVDALWQAFVTSIADGIVAHATGATDYLSKLISDLLAKLGSDLSVLGDRATSILQTIMQPGSLSQGDPLAIRDFLIALPVPVRVVLLSLMGPFVFGAYLNAFHAPFVEQIRQAAMAELVPMPLAVPALTELVKRRDVTAGWARDQARRSGISGELFELLLRLERQYLTAGNYVEMWLRTGDENQLDNLRKIGVVDEDIDRLKELSLAIATPSDLVRFLVRDVFDPHAVETGQLDADFEAKYREDIFRKSGVSKELARQYWMAHWSLPSPSQGYQMLHRGLIDNAQLLDLLKLADYAPGWVQRLADISYNVPGRIDVRRMFDAGILTTHEELVAAHQRMGYSPADADVLARFVEAITQKERDNDAARKRAPIAAAVVRSFVVGTLSEGAASEALVGLGFSPDEATYKLREGEYSRHRDRADRIRDAIGREYTRGYLIREDALSRMTFYGFEPAEIAFMIDSWDLDRELTEMSDEKKHQKDLSKSEIIASFDDLAIGEDDARRMLLGLGYDEQEASTLLALSLAKRAKAETKLSEDAVRAQFVNRYITAQDAADALYSFGFTDKRVESLMARWMVEVETKRPEMPTAALEKLIMGALISEDDAQAELQRRGYTDADVDRYMRLWGYDVGIARDRLETQRDIAERRLDLSERLGERRLDLTEAAQEARQRQLTRAEQVQQERFETTTAQRERLQAERLEAAAKTRADTTATQLQRDAANFERQRATQERALQQQAARLQTQLDAAKVRQDQAESARADLQERRLQVTLQVQGIQDARQSRSLDAQLQRLEMQIAAADRRAELARNERAEHEAALAQRQTDLVQLRDQLAQAKEIRTEAARIATENRTESKTIRAEGRADLRRTAVASETAVAKENLLSVRLNREAQTAALMAQLAALEGQISEQRRIEAEQRAAEARRALDAQYGSAGLYDSVN